MKAAVFTGFGQPLSVTDVPEPAPGEGDVIVRVARCGICGSDLSITSDPIFAAQPGVILGHEYTGEVVELGAKVTGLRKGDRVSVLPIRSCGHCANCLAGEFAWCSTMRLEGGGYAELSAAGAIQCTRLPSTVSLQDGALIEPLAVGLHSVEVAQMTPGARVLVVGAGPIGLATAFWARRLGASRVVVTARSSTQEARAQELGATAFVQLGNDASASFERALGGLPDVVFECVGKPGVLESCIGFVRPRGTVVVVGLCTARDSFVPFVAVSKEVRIQCAAFYNLRDFEICADELDKNADAARAMVTDVVSLAAMPAAFEALRKRTSQCKVAVEP